MGPHQPSPGHDGASGGRPRGLSLGRRDRLAVGENHGSGGPRGYDAGKKINGRKRHIITDTDGLLLALMVHEAGIQDRGRRAGSLRLAP